MIQDNKVQQWGNMYVTPAIQELNVLTENVLCQSSQQDGTFTISSWEEDSGFMG